jgi:multisubunit Na+/H+ antiporter MnhE subunit
VKHVLAWVTAWLALFWLWLLMSGDWNRIEIIAAACAATIAATIAEIARSRADVASRIPFRWVCRIRP